MTERMCLVWGVEGVGVKERVAGGGWLAALPRAGSTERAGDGL